MNMKKRKIKRVSVVDQVSNSIKEDIAAKIYQPGDKLPSEEVLAESFGVNRLSVRMALQKLCALGIIETRVGEGSYVRNFSFKPFLNEIAIFYGDDSYLEEIRSFRNLLESECLRLAIQSSTNEEQKALHEALEHYNLASETYNSDISNEEYLDQLVDLDLAFHMQVVKMSRNRLYIDIYSMVQVLIRDHIKQLLSRRVHARYERGLPVAPSSDTHTQIYEAIISKNTEIAAHLISELLGIVPVEGMDIFNGSDISSTN